MVSYFEFYGIPVNLKIDHGGLRKTFFENSRKFHPDFHTFSGPEEQAEMLEKSTVNNAAFKTLSDFDLRLKYILQLNDQLGEAGENKVPEDFLMDMMEFNEEMMELEMNPDPEKKTQLIESIAQVKIKLREGVEQICAKEDLVDLDPAEWNTLRNYHLKTKYLSRLSEQADSL